MEFTALGLGLRVRGGQVTSWPLSLFESGTKPRTPEPSREEYRRLCEARRRMAACECPVEQPCARCLDDQELHRRGGK